jgi:hypothetical protein
VNHCHALLLSVGQGKKGAGLLYGLLQRLIDAVVDQIKETDIAGGVAQVGEKRRFFSGVRVAGQIQYR